MPRSIFTLEERTKGMSDIACWTASRMNMASSPILNLSPPLPSPPIFLQSLIYESTHLFCSRPLTSDIEMPDWKWRKTAGPYIVGGAKTTLDVLSAVSSVIAPPGVKVAIGVALQIIKIVEGVNANRDDTKQLVERLTSLLLLLSNAYDGKKDDELTVDIRESVARLTSNLDAILDGVKQMQESINPRTFGSYVKGGLLYVKNGQKIKGYTADIGWAMDVFQAESRIRDAVHIRGIGANTRDILKAVENTKPAPNAQD
ncbi:hypothetical protein FRB94_008241, partial [Tulasnella sp. JGI-2019a]